MSLRDDFINNCKRDKPFFEAIRETVNVSINRFDFEKLMDRLVKLQMEGYVKATEVIRLIDSWYLEIKPQFTGMHPLGMRKEDLKNRVWNLLSPHAQETVTHKVEREPSKMVLRDFRDCQETKSPLEVKGLGDDIPSISKPSAKDLGPGCKILYWCVGCNEIHYDEDYSESDGDKFISSHDIRRSHQAITKYIEDNPNENN